VDDSKTAKAQWKARVNYLSVEQFLFGETAPLIDVRSPKEFTLGHIPGAINLPLLSDEQRKNVGRLYKKDGKQAAVLEGLAQVGPNLHELALNGLGLAKKGKVILYCQRGGMRSQSVAWLLTIAGIHVKILEGGYKAFRGWVNTTLCRPLDIVLLSGQTGVGKTDLLQEMKSQGEQIVDLEGVAHHKGSAFGGIGEQPQPSTVQYENQLAMLISQLDLNQRVWIENESRMVGKCVIPEGLWRQMQQASFVLLHRDKDERIKRLCQDYRMASDQEITDALKQISKRLGAEKVTIAMTALDNENREKVASIALEYYDHLYKKSLKKKSFPPDQVLNTSNVQFDSLVGELVRLFSN
jgi:tRNA 2-selenouridine synthase